jgi:hypothetical protein
VSESTIQKAFQINVPLFLIGENPFNADNWKSGNQLVFGILDDINENLCKVRKNMIRYKKLLIVAGAKELKEINDQVTLSKYSQREKLFDSLIKNPATRYHDVIFEVRDEETNNWEKIGANRYVLSGKIYYYYIYM